MICLNMIVKNEAHCIARCLRSVRPYIDAAVIVDTGSTDGTEEIIADEMCAIPAPLLIFSRPWVGFGPNRTEATKLTKAFWYGQPSRAETFLLFIDADETLEGRLPSPEELAEVDVVYCQGIGPTQTSVPRLLLARASVPWKFEPITHESLMPADERKIQEMRQLDWPHAIIRQYDDSARQKSGKKSEEDVAQLTEWLRERPNDSRAQFYLARSFRFGGRNAEAFSAYARRCEMRGGDPQEVVMSRIDMAKIQTEDGDFEMAKLNYMAAYRLDPHRAEPLCGLASLCIETRDLVTAEMAARQACALERPMWRLFDEAAAYDWIRWDLLAQSLIAVGGERRLDEARGIVSERPMPESESARYKVIWRHLWGIPQESEQETPADLTE